MDSVNSRINWTPLDSESSRSFMVARTSLTHPVRNRWAEEVLPLLSFCNFGSHVFLNLDARLTKVVLLDVEVDGF